MILLLLVKRHRKCRIPLVEEHLKLAAYLDGIVGKNDDVINVLGGTNIVFEQCRQTLIEKAVRRRVIVK